MALAGPALAQRSTKPPVAEPGVTAAELLLAQQIETAVAMLGPNAPERKSSTLATSGLPVRRPIVHSWYDATTGDRAVDVPPPCASAALALFRTAAASPV